MILPSGRPTPRVITFYSYKGGTGRTMLLANVAWILASNGHRVLTVDWDLEAPGLHRYFAPFLVDKKLESSDGIIDMVTHFAVQAMTTSSEAVTRERDWYKALADIKDYTVTLQWTFPNEGRLDFVPAGCQGPTYSTRVNSFNWQSFYDRLGGGAFLEAVKESMRADYDYILIDSRTGVSDTAGVCTVQFPDDLVVCFTLNHQSILGASSVVESVTAQRQDKKIRVFPVPTRVEDAEKHKLDYGRDAIRDRFGSFLESWIGDKNAQETYWGSVEIPYNPYYAYEEILATFGDRPNQTNSLLAAMERFTAYLTDGSVTRLAELPDEKRRLRLAEFERSPKASNNQYNFDVYISFSSKGMTLAHELADGLSARGLSVFKPRGVPSETIHYISTAMHQSKHAIIILSGEFSTSQQVEVGAILANQAMSQNQQRLVIPVLSKGATLPDSGFLAAIQALYLNELTYPKLWISMISEAIHSADRKVSTKQ